MESSLMGRNPAADRPSNCAVSPSFSSGRGNFPRASVVADQEELTCSTVALATPWPWASATWPGVASSCASTAPGRSADLRRDLPAVGPRRVPWIRRYSAAPRRLGEPREKANGYRQDRHQDRPGRTGQSGRMCRSAGPARGGSARKAIRHRAPKARPGDARRGCRHSSAREASAGIRQSVARRGRLLVAAAFPLDTDLTRIPTTRPDDRRAASRWPSAPGSSR